MKRALMIAAALVAAGSIAAAQGTRPLSPSGSSQTQVGGKWVPTANGESTYQGGKWIEITYGRPIKRGRTDLWGSGANYGKKLLAGAPVWRAGANASTRLKTEVPLQIGGKTVAPGEYSLFIDPKDENDWTLIVSSWAAQQKYDPANKTALWGAYNYTPDKDVARVKMNVDHVGVSIDQLTWEFCDMTNTGGSLLFVWDTTVATAPFTVAEQAAGSSSGR